MGVASLVRLYLKNAQMDEADFFNAGADSGKLKVASVIFVWVWSKMGMTF